MPTSAAGVHPGRMVLIHRPVSPAAKTRWREPAASPLFIGMHPHRLERWPPASDAPAATAEVTPSPLIVLMKELHLPGNKSQGKTRA